MCLFWSIYSLITHWLHYLRDSKSGQPLINFVKHPYLIRICICLLLIFISWGLDKIHWALWSKYEQNSYSPCCTAIFLQVSIKKMSSILMFSIVPERGHVNNSSGWVSSFKRNEETSNASINAYMYILQTWYSI